MAPSTYNNIRICTYNVLSSSLAGPSHFTHCQPDNLEAEVRLKRVYDKLEKEIEKSSIFCLQEVSMLWAGRLHQFFQERDYYFVHRLYGKPFNGYMGVGLAYPSHVYKSLEVNIDRLADSKAWPKDPSSPFDSIGSTVGVAYNTMKSFINYFNPIRVLSGYLGYRQSEVINSYEYAKMRNNAIVHARLQRKDTGAVFCVSTYHMPCAFYAPQVMTIHIALAIQYIQSKAKGCPSIIAGDFNIKPNDACYELVTTGQLDRTHDNYPIIPSYDEWSPNLERPMLSAYKEIHGSEPDFTNNAQIKDDPAFIETLDYVFHTDDIQVVDVPELPHRDTIQGPLPNDTEPSDHIMLIAEFSLDNPSAKEN